MGDLFAWLRGQADRAAALGAGLLGAVFVFVGWVGASGSSLTTEQIPFLASGAVGGLFLLGVAATMWLSADLRDEWRKLDDIYRLMLDERSETDSEAGSEVAEAVAVELDDEPPLAVVKGSRAPRVARRALLRG